MAWTKVKLAVAASMAVVFAYQYHQNSVQAQQLDAAREDLRLTSEAAGAQQSRIAELDQQTTAIMETRREQEQDLARLRARRKGVARGTQSKSAAGAPTTLLSTALQDPVARATLHGEFVESARKRWDPLVKELKLNSEDAEKLFQIGGDWYMRGVEAVAAFTEGKITAEAAVQAGAQAEQDARNQVRLLVGEGGMLKFDERVSSKILRGDRSPAVCGEKILRRERRHGRTGEVRHIAQVEKDSHRCFSSRCWRCSAWASLSGGTSPVMAATSGWMAGCVALLRRWTYRPTTSAAVIPCCRAYAVRNSISSAGKFTVNVPLGIMREGLTFLMVNLIPQRAEGKGKAEKPGRSVSRPPIS